MAFTIGAHLGKSPGYSPLLSAFAALLCACGSASAPNTHATDTGVNMAPVVLERPVFDITLRHDPISDYSPVDLPRMVEDGLDGGLRVNYTTQGPVTETSLLAARNTALLRVMTMHACQHGLKRAERNRITKKSFL